MLLIVMVSPLPALATAVTNEAVSVTLKLAAAAGKTAPATAAPTSAVLASSADLCRRRNSLRVLAPAIHHDHPLSASTPTRCLPALHALGRRAPAASVPTC